MSQNDEYDINWDDDPFDGDFGLDMDFDMDPFKGKGFISSVASGFLSGISEETVGSSRARVKTLRTLLPDTFSNAFDRASRIADRFGDLKEEFQRENVESVKSLQSIAGSLSTRLEGKISSSKTEALAGFSQKDFSSWERGSSSSEQDGIDDVQEYELQGIMDTVLDRQEGLFYGLGDSLNGMAAAVGGRINAAIGSGNRQLVNIETGVRDLLDYQRNVQMKLDQAQVSLLARTYAANIKYYKFMERGMHAEVAELKKIVKGVMTSDFEKMSTFTRSKQHLQNSVFSTIGRRVGGLTGLIKDKFGKDARQEGYDSANSSLGMLADMLEMSEGAPMSKGMIGDMIGRQLGGKFVQEIPNFFKRGKGKTYLEGLAAKHPDKADWVSKKVAKLTATGSRASYMANAGVGLVNHMAQDYEQMDEMPFFDYEDYLESVPPGEKPMSKARWTVQNAATNRMKAGMNSFMSEMNQAKGTQYTLRKRNPRDLNNAAIWKETNNITLNEVIPGLISRTNQILEKIRTGKDDTEMTSYNYMRGEFQTETQKQVSVQADLMPVPEFSRYAQSALEFVDDLDPDKMLSQAARKAFAQVIAKDVDRDKSFNPFYYIGEIQGVSPNNQSEIHAVVRKHFGLKDEHIDKYKSTSGFERMDVMTTMPTAESQERLNKAGSSASNLKEIFPNVAERIDMLRSTGNEQLLRDLGVIYTEGGIEKVNMEVFHNRLGKFMDNPNDPTLRGMIPGEGGKPSPTLNDLGIPKRSGGGSGGTNEASFSGLSQSLNQLTEKLDSLASGKIGGNDKVEERTAYFDPGSGIITTMSDNLLRVADSNDRIEVLINKLTERAMEGKLFSKEGSPNEERQEERAKNSLFAKLKRMSPAGSMNKGMELLMRNSPTILGGLLGGGLGGFTNNPIAGASMAIGGALLGKMVQNWAKKDQEQSSSSDSPSDDENITDENGETILESAKLKAGMYIDAITKRVITTYKAIRGPVIDMGTKAVLSITTLGGKIFGADGRAVMLSGLQQAKDALVGAYNFVDPIGRLKSATELGKNLIFQQDVYVKGDGEPRLRSIGFKNMEYWKETAGSYNPIKGWNEIDGPVFDENGNELISQAEFDGGLVTASGQKVRQMGGMAASAIGSAGGFLKGGMDKLLSRVGYQRAGDASAPTAAKAGFQTGGVERRLDRIYKLLSMKFGIEVDDDVLDGESGDSGTSSGLRLNSLEDKARAAKEEQTNDVQKAIINIAENLGGKKESGPKEEKKGLFGRLFGMMGSMGGFMTNLIKNPIGTILGGIGGSMMNSTKRLASIGSALFSGVLGAASPIFKLLKSGFIGIAKAVAGGGGLLSKAVTMLGGRGGGKMSKLMRGGGRLGMLAAAGSMAYNMMGDSGSDPSVDEETGETNAFSNVGPTKGFASYAEDAAGFIPQVAIATTAAEMALPPSFIDTLKNKGVFWASDGTFFTDQREMLQYESNLNGVQVGGSTYRTTLTSTSLQKQIRFAMYGVKEWNSNLGMRIDRLELLLLSQVAITGGRASFKDPKQVGSIVKQFASSAGDIPEDQILGWFNSRFKPVFLVWCAAANIARMGDLTELDAKKNFEIVMVLNRVIESIPQIEPYPYLFDMAIDEGTALMARGQTESVISTMIKELRALYPAPETETKITTGEEQREKNLNPERSSIAAVAWLQDKFSLDPMKSHQEKIDAKFTTPAEVKEIDISDLHKDGNTSIDPFTMARLATYGNVDNMGWRIDAVLKLERYCEDKIQISGDKITFTSTAQAVLELFKPMFRIDSPLAEGNFVTWFDNRFLPVLKLYVREVKNRRGQGPKTGWLQLSATNKVDIARLLSETTVIYEGDAVTVWNVKAGPFPGSVSGDSPDRATIYLKVLDTKAMKAVLDDPALEEASSKSLNDTADSGVAKQEETRRRTQDMMARMYGKKPTGSSPNQQAGSNSSPGLGKNSATGGFANAFPQDNQPGGVYDGSWNDTFTAAVMPKPGEDAGVKIKPEEGEKMLLNGLLKAGVTDNKQLALALALAKVETGNYSSTVENTNWSAATLKKYFRNIPDMATAEKVAALPPAQRAMYVYGRAPKGPTLGNQKPEDGWLYRGRGLFQLTGKANYEKYARESGVDVVGNPKLVSEDPAIMTDTAVRYLMGNKAIQSIATTGSFDEAVRGINGGGSVPFTEERRKWYNDYLAKLQSGALTVGETKTSDFAPDAANPTQEVPNAADANLPPDAPSKTTDNIKPSNKNDITAALNTNSDVKSVQAGSPTSTVTPTAAKSPETEPVTEAPKQASPAPAKAPAASAPVASSKPAPVVTETRSAKPQAPAAPSSPSGSTQVSDTGAHQILGEIAKRLSELTRTVEKLQQNDHGVRLS